MGLRRPFHQLIKWLDQYKATIEESAQTVLDLEASTSRAKGKRAERRMRKKDEAKSAASSAMSAPVTLMSECKRKNGIMVR